MPDLHTSKICAVYQLMAASKDKKGSNHTLGRSLNLSEQLSRFPDELLDRQCADAHLNELTGCFSEWQLGIAPGLELTTVEIKDIETAWPREPQRQRLEMFRTWQEKMNAQATYRYDTTYNILYCQLPII